MEIFYCTTCKHRVSSVDVAEGRGVQVEHKCYCKECAVKAGIEAAPPAARPGSTSGRPASGVTRGGVTAQRRAPAAPSGRPAAVMAVIMLVVITLGLAVTVFVLMRARRSESVPVSLKPAPAPSAPAAVVPAPIRPEPAPVRTAARTTPASRPVMPGDPVDFKRVAKPPAAEALPARPVLPEPSPEPIATGDGWGPPVRIDPVGESTKWAMSGGGRYYEEGGALVLDSNSLDLYRREPLGDVRVEGICDFPGAQDWQDRVGFFFSKTGPNRQDQGFKIYFMYDTTLEVHYMGKEVGKRMYGWTRGKPFAFAITQQGARMTVAVNGTVLVDYTASETPARGGFQVSPSKKAATGRIVLKDFVLRKPAVVP
ncbi:MAG: hypothetical protein ABIF71_13580 [Planctomycetota bacterium]